MLFIPESPRWLFQNEGKKSKQAIKNLNYIAWVNQSSLRIPEDSCFDLAR
jgi:hypothetical protein